MKKFPAQNGRARAPENGAIAVQLDTERPASPDNNILHLVLAMFLLAPTPLNWSVSGW
jgi:hypothetical protein